MPIPNPITLRDQRKSGREDFVHYMLASFIHNDTPKRYNTSLVPSPEGKGLLKRLDSLGFSNAEWAESPGFFWEFRLDSITEGDGLRWPDLAALWPDRLLLMELKTEAGSHREGQVDEYIIRARHHYPDHSVDLIYLTTDPISGEPDLPERCRYANVTWRQLAPHIEEIWSAHADPRTAAIALVYADYLLTGLGLSVPKRPATKQPESVRPAIAAATLLDADAVQADDVLLMAIEAALQTETTGKQQVLHAEVTSPKSAERLCSLIREAIRRNNATGGAAITHAVPWVWQEKSSGQPLSDSGREHGVEIRFSYYKRGNVAKAD